MFYVNVLLLSCEKFPLFYRELNPTNDCCVWLTSSSYGPSYFFAFSFVYIENKRIRKISNEDTFIHIFNQKISFRCRQSTTKKLGEGGGGWRKYSSGHIEKEDDKIIRCHIEAISKKVNYLSIFVVVISEVNNLHQYISMFVWFYSTIRRRRKKNVRYPRMITNEIMKEKKTKKKKKRRIWCTKWMMMMMIDRC